MARKQSELQRFTNSISDKDMSDFTNAKMSADSEGSENLHSSAKSLSTGKGDVRVKDGKYDRFGDNMSVESEPARQSRNGRETTASGPKPRSTSTVPNPSGSCAGGSDASFLTHTTKGK
jgi:hypothetical protein